MFILKSTPGKIKFIRKLLGNRGLQVIDTICPEFIITARDPTPYLPHDYLKNAAVEKLDDNWQQIVKGYRHIDNLISAPPEYESGAPVRVISGEYKDFTGIVLNNYPSGCDVEVSVFGKIVRLNIKYADLEPHRTPVD